MRKLIRGLLTELGLLKPKIFERAEAPIQMSKPKPARRLGKAFKPKPPQTGGGASNM